MPGNRLEATYYEPPVGLQNGMARGGALLKCG